jgi:hypothetical protein
MVETAKQRVEEADILQRVEEADILPDYSVAAVVDHWEQELAMGLLTPQMWGSQCRELTVIEMKISNTVEEEVLVLPLEL